LLIMSTLDWIEQNGGRCVARRDDLLFVVEPFSPAARDGDPLLHMNDDQYRPDAWAMVAWRGMDTTGPVRLFDSIGAAKSAAEES
jgi:hypothetical protein